MDVVRKWLQLANSVVALIGAGVSAESGVPTFRGNNGLWKQRRPKIWQPPVRLLAIQSSFGSGTIGADPF